MEYQQRLRNAIETAWQASAGRYQKKDARREFVFGFLAGQAGIPTDEFSSVYYREDHGDGSRTPVLRTLESLHDELRRNA